MKGQEHVLSEDRLYVEAGPCRYRVSRRIKRQVVYTGVFTEKCIASRLFIFDEKKYIG